ncbi:cardiolipin synthase [Sinomonas notoginsengisoli]|uniref:cardiolipin synthase n=1 Tax=Sinomonas notoginsengisoli TaxID=1457311 RepID=UPI001F3B1CDA|nr:cardiolipin synthase [Sinomonas notoginsengisoli]
MLLQLPLIGLLPDWLTFALGVVDFVIRIAVLGIIPGNRRPTTAMAWLLAIFFVPTLGLVLFLMFGNFRFSGKRRDQQQEVNARVRAALADSDEVDTTFDGPDWLHSAAELNRGLGSLPMVNGNAVRLIPGYEDAIAEMADAVRKAKRFVNAEFYIVSWDEVTEDFFTALTEAAERGVEVRFLYDHIGSLRIPGYRSFKRRLKDSKVRWRPMLPLLPVHGQWRRVDLRNHRKILVVDGETAFTGSLNLIERAYHRRAKRKWVELMARIEGPAVTTLNVVFATDWLSETDEMLESQLVAPEPAGETPAQVVPSGPAFANENNLRLFNTLIYSAQHRLSICSPYFVPDDSLLYAVTTAAQRGVAVELFVSEQGDQFLVHHAQQSYYEALLTAGVAIYRYPKPFVLHAKHFTVDDDVAVLGSSNMDMRSFSLNMEVSLMLPGQHIVEQMRKVEDMYREVSKRLDLREWRTRPLLSRYVDNVARLTATLQ